MLCIFCKNSLITFRMTHVQYNRKHNYSRISFDWLYWTSNWNTHVSYDIVRRKISVEKWAPCEVLLQCSRVTHHVRGGQQHSDERRTAHEVPQQSVRPGVKLRAVRGVREGRAVGRPVEKRAPAPSAHAVRLMRQGYAAAWDDVFIADNLFFIIVFWWLPQQNRHQNSYQNDLSTENTKYE